VADDLVSRLQRALLTVGAIGSEAHVCGPFTVIVDPHDPLVNFNYAVPREAVGGDLSAQLAALRARFARLERVPRLEFLEEFAPELAGELERAGFALELRQPLMTCSGEQLLRPPVPPGVNVELVDEAAPLDSLRDLHELFDAAFEVETAPGAIRDPAQDGGGAVLLRRGDEAVAAGTWLPPHDGLVELGGVATAAPYRRQGLGALATALATDWGLAAGARLAFLTPGGDDSRRVYERIGFRAELTMLAYRASPTP
jgi:GNAT superfamily N-acetyltransferase